MAIFAYKTKYRKIKQNQHTILCWFQWSLCLKKLLEMKIMFRIFSWWSKSTNFPIKKKLENMIFIKVILSSIILTPNFMLFLYLFLINIFCFISKNSHKILPTRVYKFDNPSIQNLRLTRYEMRYTKFSFSLVTGYT